MAITKAVFGLAVIFLCATSVTSAITNCTQSQIIVTNSTVNGTVVSATREVCTQCNLGYTLAVNNQSCTTCPLNCATCNLQGACLSCFNNQNVINGACGTCGQNCQTCTAGGCQGCISGYFLRMGGCVACSKYCATCSSEDRCDTCLEDYERFRFADKSDYFYCKLKENHRSAWWTWLVVAGILALLLFAICCYTMSGQENTNPFYAPLSATTPAYQMTTTEVRATGPAYGAVMAPAQTSVLMTPGASNIQGSYVPMGAQPVKTGYFAGY